MPSDRQILLRATGIEKAYRRSWWTGQLVYALRGADLEIAEKRCTALVGASGSGKTTLARCISGLERPTAGRIEWAGLENRAPAAHPAQLVFQDAATSFNPRMSVLEILEEPLLLRGGLPRGARREKVYELLETVGLAPSCSASSPARLSGGQQKRLAIARALAAAPRLLILDEAFAGLDASVQAQVSNLILELQRTTGLTQLLISHDLGLAGAIADELAIMSEGTVVEQGPAARTLAESRHPATRRLIEASPIFELPPLGD